MRILVSCEESQAVTIELRAKGHEAFSCDIMESSGELWRASRMAFTTRCYRTTKAKMGYDNSFSSLHVFK